jgi:hypothetical protein
MLIESKYQIGQRVYLITDEDQKARIITSITVYPGNLLSYQLTYGTHASDHYEFEFSDKENILMKTA